MKERRNTRQRALILETVQKHRDHPSAEQIYLEVRAVSPKISRGTVYRNLKLLSETGGILHMEMPDADRFDWRNDRHYHLRCTGCGRVIDVPIGYREDLDHALAEQTGYLMVFHHTTFEGLCPACRESREQENQTTGENVQSGSGEQEREGIEK